MLFKGGRDLPTEASVFAADHPAVDGVKFGDSTPKISSPADDALVLARAEIQEVHGRLRQLQTDHIAELRDAREAALREALASHVRNDEAQLAALSSTLIEAREVFAAGLHSASQGLAAQLAQAALQRLVDVHRDDVEWLLRVIERRLAELDTASVISVAVPEAFRAVADKLATPAGTTLVFDPALPNGSARIDLAVGGIPIRIEDGLARVIAALDLESETHG